MKGQLIHAEKITKIFGGTGFGPFKKPKVSALSGVNLEIGTGEIFGLLGPDGAGKTTLLRILAGLLNPTSGIVELFGMRQPEDAEKIRSSLGYMSQRFTLYSDLSVEENLMFFADIYGVNKIDLAPRLKELYKLTRLEEVKSRPAGKLSGGMKQKLALMCTLLPQPKLLLLDEPTTGVDPISRREFWEILQALLEKGVTILTSTPYMDEAEWCTRIGLLHQGHFLATASPRDLKEKFGGAAAEIQLPRNPEPVLKIISEFKSLIDSNILGERIRITADNESQMEKIEKKLGRKAELKHVLPTIEDVFLRLIREDG